MKKALDFGAAYNLYQRAIWREAAHLVIRTKYFPDLRNQRILDVGCGARPLVDKYRDIHPQNYLGFDISERYVAHCRAKFPAFRFLCGSIEDLTDGQLGQGYDLAYVHGVLHHLSDEEAARLLQLLLFRLRDRGKIFAVDPVIVEDQHLVSRFFISRDRGQFVRSLPGYQGLWKKASSSSRVSFNIETNLLRIPYDLLMAEIWAR